MRTLLDFFGNRILAGFCHAIRSSAKGLFLTGVWLVLALCQISWAIPITSPTTLPVSVDVNNDITINVTNTDLGRFSVTGDITDTAIASFTPAGVVTSDTGTGLGVGSAQRASFVWSQSQPPQTPTVALSAGFHSAPFTIQYSNVTNMTCTGGSVLRITHITDDLATPTVWDRPGGGAPTSSAGRDFLNAAGSKTFHIGLTLATSVGHVYTSGLCTGSFEFTVAYD